MNAQQAAVRRPPRQKRISTASSRSKRVEPGPYGVSLVAGYQQQIAELEGTITHLRQRAMDLNASISELLDSRADLNDLFHSAPVGYVVHDHAGVISEVNHTARLLLGLAKADPGRISLVQFLPKEQVPL